ncbi:MAG: hypothetical protein EP329_00005 [Deltaproteobacteria bacterium]|nr:MAG: hypothetical protein EP329_00005 [Deltaproteobacteria bacterium]
MTRRGLVLLTLLGGIAQGACGAEMAAPAGARLSLDVAALSLPGVGDVVWDVEVDNGASPAEVVWQRRLSSSAYGDGAGSASYVGPCDADPDVAENTVKVWVVGVYSGPVTALGSFASGAPGGVAGPALDFQSPTATGPLTRTVMCDPNADVAVAFDVALMRPAQQGFFDVAVSFNDVFCSAKLDCCVENAAGDACASDLALLFDAAGARAATMVMGFACTAGPRADVTTELYLDALALDCSSPAGGFTADLVLDPSGAAGNQCVAGEVGGGACAAVTEPGGLDADAYLYQVAVFRGQELLESGGEPAQKVYWNVALGVRRKVGAGAGIEDCWLRTRGTADDGAGTALVDGGTIAAGAVYPFIRWDADLASCQEEPLSLDDPAAMVRAEYTTTDGAGVAFAFAFAPSVPAPTGPCGLLGVPCPAGFSCEPAPAGAAYAERCVSVAGDEVAVPAGTFWMGCHAGNGDVCETDEVPQHEVALAAYAVDLNEVSAADYEAWCEPATGTPPAGCTPSGREGTDLDATYPPAAGGGTKLAHPVNYVSYDQATTYCADHGRRLCTEAEWERAARGGCETLTGTCQTAMRTYPWGNTDPVGCAEANWLGCAVATSASPVGSYPGGMSPYGAMDMAGNVWEWVEDWYVSYPGSTTPFDATGTNRIIRGGRWASSAAQVTTTDRKGWAAAGDLLGFRCCRTLP